MNRREFFKVVAPASISAQLNLDPALYANTEVPLDPNLVAIFSDPHIPDDETKPHIPRFKMCVKKILAMNPRPATLLIYGDLVYTSGGVELYKILRSLLEPLDKAGIKWEVTMGNHDRIADYQAACPDRFTEKPIIEGRCIHIVETPRADFILLDSYLEGQVAGAIAPDQKAWLAETLKKYTEKPVFVGCHHGLPETKLDEVLLSCPKFAAYIHGHWHWWKNSKTDDGIQTICFPSVGHWGDLGFTMCHLGEKEATFVPDIDAYLCPDWGKNRFPKIPNVEAYLEALNEVKVVVPFK